MQGHTLHLTTTRRTHDRPVIRPWYCPRDASCPSRLHHDNARGYWAGCPSSAARADKARYNAEWRAGRRPHLVDATGTVRRLQALHALGWTDAELGGRIFLSKHRVRNLRVGESPQVKSTTAERIAWLYLELSETTPPPSRGASRARTEARRAEEQPPEAWDLDSIDDPAVLAWKYERPTVPAHHEEQAAMRMEEVAVLTRARHSNAEIAVRLHIHPRTAERLRIRAVEEGLLSPAAIERAEEPA